MASLSDGNVDYYLKNLKQTYQGQTDSIQDVALGEPVEVNYCQ